MKPKPYDFSGHLIFTQEVWQYKFRRCFQYAKNDVWRLFLKASSSKSGFHKYMTSISYKIIVQHIGQHYDSDMCSNECTDECTSFITQSVVELVMSVEQSAIR